MKNSQFMFGLPSIIQIFLKLFFKTSSEEGKSLDGSYHWSCCTNCKTMKGKKEKKKNVQVDMMVWALVNSTELVDWLLRLVFINGYEIIWEIYKCNVFLRKLILILFIIF